MRHGGHRPSCHSCRMKVVLGLALAPGRAVAEVDMKEASAVIHSGVEAITTILSTQT